MGRFPPTASNEIQYLNAKGALTYTDIAAAPVLYGNLPPREISMKDVVRSGDSSKKFKIAESKTSYDADNRPLLVMASNLWLSSSDVDGCDYTSLGQFSGRVQQTYKHSVPRFFVP